MCGSLLKYSRSQNCKIDYVFTPFAMMALNIIWSYGISSNEVHLCAIELSRDLGTRAAAVKESEQLSASGTMKTKELSKQRRDKVLEKCRSGLGSRYQTLWTSHRAPLDSCLPKMGKVLLHKRETCLEFAQRHIGNSKHVLMNVCFTVGHSS